MVTRAVSILLVSAIFVVGDVSGREYRIGDKADRDIVTPVPLVVVDIEATDELKEKEAQRVPVVYRYYPNAANECVAAFQTTFDRTRSNFLDAVEVRFGKRTLSPDEISSNDFQRFLTQFQKQNILFPVGLRLARIWLQGESDDAYKAPLMAKLREPMRGYIRPDTGPKDIWVGSTIRLVSLADNEEATATVVAERGFNVGKTNFIATQRAKSDLLDRFPAEERSVAKYLASFIKPNCLMEAELTRQLREQRTANLSIASRYNSGDVIVRRGQVIDARIKAALDELQEKNALAIVKNVEQPRVEILPKPWPWVIGGAAAVLLIMMVWRLTRRPPPMAMVPASLPVEPVATVPTQAVSASEHAWKARALQAEEQAAKAKAVVREGLLAQLARWMSDKMTRRLVEQRAELLSAHQKAAVEVAELEARLEKVQAPLQERLAAYESRIAELEKELLAKGEENRELIKAKIQIIRKQVEIERDKRRLEFN